MSTYDDRRREVVEMIDEGDRNADDGAMSSDGLADALMEIAEGWVRAAIEIEAAALPGRAAPDVDDLARALMVSHHEAKWSVQPYGDNVPWSWQQIAAAVLAHLPAASEAAAPDVDRLAVAMHVDALGCGYLDERHIDPIDGHREHAAAIVRAYRLARLAATPDTESQPDEGFDCPLIGCDDSFTTDEALTWHMASSHEQGPDA